jgi:hypothetical protein
MPKKKVYTGAPPDTKEGKNAFGYEEPEQLEFPFINEGAD